MRQLIHIIASTLILTSCMDKKSTILNELKSSDKTESIFVRISDADEVDWFYTDAVYIVGNWTVDEMREIVKDLQPDEIYEDWMYGKPVNVPQTNSKVLSLWWD